MKHLCAILIAAVLAACATPEASRAPSDSSSGAESQIRVGTQFTQAATTPLSDLNLVRADIPPVLLAAQKGPYLPPPDRACSALAADIQGLDVALGADLDTPATASNPGLIERGTGAIGEGAVGAVRRAAEGVVPFRGWVRKLTGAERYAREVAAAISAGTVRRAFLKGLGQAGGCLAPASPRG